MGRNILKLDVSGFEKMLTKLDSLGGDVQKAVEESLTKASSKISADTLAALAPSKLPAGGKYSKGDTKNSVITDARINWEGQVGWIPVGFNFSAKGAGGFLISGTPRMRPDAELNKMYKQKKYMNEIQKEMKDVILDHIIAHMG